jgi:hypothetical protein
VAAVRPGTRLVRWTVKKETPPTLEASTDPAADQKKWTVMVFMGVGHVEGTAAPLDVYAGEDIDEMRQVFSDGPSDRLNIFVQQHGNGIPTREWIGQGHEEVPPDKRDATGGHALKEFICWALEKALHDESDHSLLVLWGHAYHFALGHIETQTGIDALDFGELADVLTQAQHEILDRFRDRWKARGYLEEIRGLPRLDMLAFDACDLSGIEIANHLQPYVRYLVASQIGIPLPGWPYKTILGRLKESANGQKASRHPMTPADFGSFIVRKFCEEYQNLDVHGQPRPVSLTLLDLDKAPGAFLAAELLAECLAAAGAADANELAAIQEAFLRSQTLEGKPFIDVADFCLNLTRISSYPEVSQAAAALGDILIRPSSNGNGDSSRGSFILEHSRNSHQTARLHGVSLYAPFITGEDWRTPRFAYNKFGGSRETYWSRLVHVLAEGR